MKKQIYRILIYIIIPSFLLYSCNGESENGDYIPKDKMEKIMLDVNLAEAYSAMSIDSLHKAGIKNTDSLAKYYKEIFKHHGITEEDFKRSLEWYKSRPDELDSVINNLVPVINKLQMPLR